MATVDKSDTPAHEHKINLKVLGADNSVVSFKMKTLSSMNKLMKKYCERAGLDMGTVRFRIDGLFIREFDTPLSLELKEWDTIEVFQQQTGGLNIFLDYY